MIRLNYIEEDGMSNHPYHEPRAVAINAALEFNLVATSLPEEIDTDYLMVGGHSLGAGYSFLVLEWALSNDWGVRHYS